MANNEKQKWEKVEQTHIIENETKQKTENFGSHVKSRNNVDFNESRKRIQMCMPSDISM